MVDLKKKCALRKKWIRRKKEFAKSPVREEAKKKADPKTIRDDIIEAAKLKKFLSNDIELVMVEWAINFPDTSVSAFLKEIKKYSEKKVVVILERFPKELWENRREQFQDKVTERLVQRHTDMLAMVQEQHVRSSNLGLAKAIEMLSKFQIEPMRNKDGKVVMDAFTRKPIYRGFRSIDLLNCMSAIEKAQIIYRRAMGLPNDGEGLAQILDRINANPTTQNVQINNYGSKPVEVDPVREKVQNMSYDEIMLFIEHKREKVQKEKDEIRKQKLLVENGKLKLSAGSPRT